MFEKSSTEMKLSLHLPSSHPERPHPALLHAICGAASIYTDWVPPTRLPFYGRVPSRALSLTDYLFIALSLSFIFRSDFPRLCQANYLIYPTLSASITVALHLDAYTKTKLWACWGLKLTSCKVSLQLRLESFPDSVFSGKPWS